MLQNWLTLVPPALVIVAAIITRRIHPSLLIGIIAACLVAAHGAIYKSAMLGFTALWGTLSDIDNLYLYGFLLGIGVLVSLFSTTGFAISFAQSVTKKIRSAKHVQYSSIIVSLMLFIDDYLSILTTGYVMSPLIDHFRVSREKLAFLVHSLAGPVAILVPVSTWVATILAYIEQAGVSTNPDHGTVRIVADPFFIFLKSLPFILYSLLIIASVWVIVYANISFGPMRSLEEQAEKKEAPPTFSKGPATMRNLLIPLGVLIGVIAFGLPFAGGYYLFGGSHSLIESLKYNEHPFLVMLIAVICAIGTTIALAGINKAIATAQVWPIAKNGFSLMIGAITMVFLASTLSGLLANQVGTGQYLASILLGAIPLALLPVMFFIVSLMCTIATGSAWGNFALMIPIAIPMLTSLSGLALPIDPSALTMLLPVLGAIFSGSVCGDHISPLSETSTMTATSTGTSVLSHTYTQLFYALPAVASSIIGYTVMGLLVGSLIPWLNIGISLFISGAFCIFLLFFLGKRMYPH